MLKNALTRSIRTYTVLAGALIATPVAQADNGVFFWDGFLTSAYAVSDDGEAYRESVDDRGALDDSRFGLHFTSELTPDWSVEGQFFAAGYEDNYTAILDWAFGSYRPREGITVNMGRLKYPNNIVSEYYDVGLAYPWVRPPHEFYSLEDVSSLMTMEAFEGITAIFSGYVNAMEVSAQPFFGEANIEDEWVFKQLAGLKLTISDDHFQAHVAYVRASVQALEEGEGGAAENEGFDGLTKQVTSIGLTFDLHDVVGYGEYAFSTLEEYDDLDTQAGYVTLGYRIRNTLPHVTYGMFHREDGWGQHTVSLGVKHLINPSVALKTEWQRVKPDAAGEDGPSGLFEGSPSDKRVNVFTVAIDVVF